MKTAFNTYCYDMSALNFKHLSDRLTAVYRDVFIVFL
jgi:hypothetical protein